MNILRVKPMLLILATLTVETRANPLASATTMTGAIVVANVIADYTNSTSTAPPTMLGTSGRTCGTNGKLTNATDYPLEYLYCSPRSCVNLASQWFNGQDGTDDKDDICDCPSGYLPESFPKPANVQQTRRHIRPFWTTYRTDDLFVARCKYQNFWNNPCSRNDPSYYSNYELCHDVIACGEHYCYDWDTLKQNDYTVPDAAYFAIKPSCPSAYYQTPEYVDIGQNTAGDIAATVLNLKSVWCKRCRSQKNCALDWGSCLKYPNAFGGNDGTPSDKSSTDLGCKEATPGYYINARVVTPCTSVPNAIGFDMETTCTTATDSLVRRNDFGGLRDGCATGYFDNRTTNETGPSVCTLCVNQVGCAQKVDRYEDECMCQNKQRGRCLWNQLNDPQTLSQCARASPGYYIGTDGLVRPCTGNVTHAAANATYTCTGATDSVPSACAPGYVVTGTGCEEQ